MPSGSVFGLLVAIGLLILLGLQVEFPVTGAPPVAAAQAFLATLGMAPDSAVVCRGVLLHWQCDAAVYGKPVMLRCDNGCRLTQE